MYEVLVLTLVFVATAFFSWILVPILVEVGLQRAAGKYVRREGSDYDPMYRFTTPERLVSASLACALLGGGFAIVVMVVVKVMNPFLLAAAGIGTGVVLFQFPKLWLHYRITSRQRLFHTRLVDLTVGLANGLRAGSSLPQSLAYVGRDMGGPVGEEFNILLHEHRLGIDLAEGFTRLCRRMPSEDLTLLSTAVRLTLQAGGSLAEVLDKITSTIRERIEFQQRLRTMTTQGRFEALAMALAPLIAMILFSLIDFELMRPLFTTKIGWYAIGGVLVLECIGFYCINRIVTIEV